MAATWDTMEQLPVSEVLPGLYRAVLDAVARLEAHGHRREAARIRTEATTTYSKAWTPAADRHLRKLRERADRIMDSRRRTITHRKARAGSSPSRKPPPEHATA